MAAVQRHMAPCVQGMGDNHHLCLLRVKKVITEEVQKLERGTEIYWEEKWGTARWAEGRALAK